MSAVQRRTPSRLFQTTEYRVFNPDVETNEEETSRDFCLFFNKRTRNRGDDFSFVRQKSFLLRQACLALRMEYLDAFNQSSPGKDQNSTLQSKVNNEIKENFLSVLPREIVIKILQNLQPQDITRFAQCSKASRFFAYDDILWKYVCCSTWCDVSFMTVGDLSKYKYNLRSWYRMNSPTDCTKLDSTQVVQLVSSQKWRIIYAAMKEYESMPCIIHRNRLIFNRTVECFGTERSVKYQSSLGHFHLKGVTQASLVEYLVFYVNKPWHRREYVDSRPLPIYAIREYGLKVTRSPRGQHNGEFFRRRGYYIKTDENRKVHLTYRYFPTIRFRLFKQTNEKVFLLCQDIFVSSGETVDCYTAYEILKCQEQQVRESSLDESQTALGSN